MIDLGFVGTGWIGRNRMEAMLATGKANAAAICDPSAEMAEQAHAAAPLALVTENYDAMLGLNPDGAVIATPSALHAEQCVQAFGHGCAVFCQKPLGRYAMEVEQVLDAARKADRLVTISESISPPDLPAKRAERGGMLSRDSASMPPLTLSSSPSSPAAPAVSSASPR